MLKLNTYRVLHSVVIEWVCYHGAHEGGSHLLLREEMVLVDDDPVTYLRAVSESSWLLHDQVRRDAVEVTVECGL